MTHSPRIVLDAIVAEGITSFFGVPDSTLNGFGHMILQPHERITGAVCSNEGSAVAEAIGYFLATGRPACVYMQNSGLPNALNPLSSLAHADIFGVPMLLLIGWRGHPDYADEPQHSVMGRETISLLQSMDIPIHQMGQEGMREVTEAAQDAMSSHGPVALLVPPKSIGSFAGVDQGAKHLGAEPGEFIDSVLKGASDDTFYFGATGFTSRLLMASAALGKVEGARVFPMVGGMGHTFAVAARFALLRPELPVVCFDGDGSVLMHTGSLARARDLMHTRFTYILLNNGAHQSVGGHPTIAPKCDFGTLARVFGFSQVLKCSSPVELLQTSGEVQSQGSTFIQVVLEPDPALKLPRPEKSPIQILRDFRAKVDDSG